LEVAAAPNNDTVIQNCESKFNACLQSCTPVATASGKCQSDCNSRYQIHCKPGADGEYVCSCASAQAIKGRLTGSGLQLQPATPKPQSPATTNPQGTTTTR
jgi:hypothetical protein